MYFNCYIYLNQKAKNNNTIKYYFEVYKAYISISVYIKIDLYINQIYSCWEKISQTINY